MKTSIGLIGICLAIGTVDNPADYSLYVLCIGVAMAWCLVPGEIK